MRTKSIPDKRIADMVEALQARASVIGPKRSADGTLRLGKIESADELEIDYRNSILSPKSVFFPQRETICALEGERVVDVPLPDGPIVLLGIRPCDSSAIQALDKVFLESSPQDPFYARRRELCTVVSFACTRPESTCFCTAVQGGPGHVHASDVLVLESDGELLLRPHSEKGEQLLESIDGLLGDASQKAIEKAETAIEQAAERIDSFTLDGVAESLQGAWESDIWTRIGQQCIGCGVCSYLCPTCHCFDISDEVQKDEGSRVRAWDCCAYPLFTLHASGHNPRASRRERWRQRAMHKFHYGLTNYDRFLCVGCGRCIRNCPVNVDLRSVLQEVRS
ncbi:MAG: 4Fe-4S dicluster domain-containing protein [Deltaproteobacteria bacterium]|nr:4Fe-4S dicluster domain-containing protein [Deltaproteobacteria bacterium]